MKWKGERSSDWRRKFALFPTTIEKGTTVVWLQSYWERYHHGDRLCEHCQLALSDRVVGHFETTSRNPNSKLIGDPFP